MAVSAGAGLMRQPRNTSYRKETGMGDFRKACAASLAGAAMALVLGLSSAGAQGQAKPFDGVPLRVATFGGPWRDDLAKNLAPKIEALGGKVEFIIGSPQDNLRSEEHTSELQ